MKNISAFFTLFLASLFILTSCGSGKKYSKVKLETKEDTVSYYLGLTYGDGLKQVNVDTIFNYKAFLKGLNEGINKDTLPVSTYTLQVYLNQYFTDLQSKQLRYQYRDYIAQNKAFMEENARKDSVVTMPSGLQYVILREGKGPKPTRNDRIRVHYTGTLIDGTIFDSSYKRNEPAVFRVGDVIPGWSEAVQLMPVGSKWRIYLPEELAYSSRAPQGSIIKPFSTLIFEVELLEILPELKK
jgi:FKBP-type peptidyl-prolyl cis-trans isomerase FklB